MAREEARARVIEDSETLDNMKVNSDGSINVKDGYGSLWPQFAASVQTTNIDADGPGTGNEVLLIRNPSGSGKRMHINDILLASYTFATSEIVVEIFANPTITSTGTLATSATVRLGSGETASCQVYDEPTASASGTRIAALQITGQNSTTNDIMLSNRLSLDPGTDVLFRGFSDGTNRELISSIWWSEEDI